MKKTFLRTFIAVLAIGTLHLGLLAQGSTETIDKVIRLDPARQMTLEFHDVDGRLRLTPSPDATVSVKVTKEAKTRDAKRAERLLRDTQVEVEQHGNTVVVRVRYPRLRGLFFWLSDYGRVNVTSEITVPAGARVKAGLVDGEIRAEDIHGEFDLSVVDGDIRLDRIEGDLKASAVDGTIDVIGVLRDLSLKTVDGDVKVAAAAGSIIASDWEIRTIDGDVEATLPEGFAAGLSIQTGDGRVNSSFPLTTVKMPGKKKYTSTLGGGGKTFTIRTTDGDITLRAK